MLFHPLRLALLLLPGVLSVMSAHAADTQKQLLDTLNALHACEVSSSPSKHETLVSQGSFDFKKGVLTINDKQYYKATIDQDYWNIATSLNSTAISVKTLTRHDIHTSDKDVVIACNYLNVNCVRISKKLFAASSQDKNTGSRHASELEKVYKDGQASGYWKKTKPQLTEDNSGVAITRFCSEADAAKAVDTLTELLGLPAS